TAAGHQQRAFVLLPGAGGTRDGGSAPQAQPTGRRRGAHFAPTWQRRTSGPTRRAASRSRRGAGAPGGGGGGAEAAAGLALPGGNRREARAAAGAPCGQSRRLARRQFRSVVTGDLAGQPSRQDRGVGGAPGGGISSSSE